MKLFFFTSISLFLICSTAFSDYLVTETSAPPSIEINGRQLIVNGNPFVIKAVCYNPVRKGESYINNNGKNPSSLMTVNPSPEDLATIEADFEAMKEAGINTIRTYYPITDSKVLKMLDDHNIKVIVPVFTTYNSSLSKNLEVIKLLKNQKSTLFWEVGNEWNYNLFYATNTASASSKTRTTPPNNNLGDKKYIDINWCIDYISSSIDTIKKTDANHPVSTCVGDISPDLNGFWKKLPYDKIDIFGVNIYDGASFNNPYSPRFNRWRAITQPPHPAVPNSDGTLDTGGIGPKPLYISEFGATAYNLALNGIPLYTQFKDVSTMVVAIDQYFLPSASQYILPITPIALHDMWGNFVGNGTVNFWGVDEAAQADGITSLVSEIQHNLSAKDPENILLGGALFEWNDEWWKSAHSNPWTHGVEGFCFTDAATGIVCGGPYPDCYFHEEWFGMLTIERKKRASYYALKALYSQK